MHILGNTVSTLILGFLLESFMGAKRLGALYIVCGIGGNVFSALFNDTICVGASTAAFGLMSCILAFVIINWKPLESQPEVRCCLIIFVVFLFLINMLFGLGLTGDSHIDVFGHLGGFIIGFFFGCCVMVNLPNPSTGQVVVTPLAKKLKKIGSLVTLAFFIAGFGIFYTLRYPEFQGASCW